MVSKLYALFFEMLYFTLYKIIDPVVLRIEKICTISRSILCAKAMCKATRWRLVYIKY